MENLKKAFLHELGHHVKSWKVLDTDRLNLYGSCIHCNQIFTLSYEALSDPYSGNFIGNLDAVITFDRIVVFNSMTQKFIYDFIKDEKGYAPTKEELSCEKTHSML